jgi:peptide/nickel transport system substrate-binding protein
MKKNSGSKDILLFSLLAFIILLIILAMYQRDREWVKLSAMERTLTEQSRDVSSLRGTLNAMQKKLDSVNLHSASNTNSTSAKSAKKVGGVSLAFKRAKIATEQPDYAQGDWSVNALGSNLKTITPLVSTDADASDVQSYILETLMTRDPDTLEWTGLIAKDWTISEDGLVITFRLRDDVYFSDGKQLDSSDVVFTFDFIMNEKIKAPRHRAYLEKIAKVEANGPYEVTFTYKEPYFEALELAGTLEIFPEHFYKEYLATPEKFNESKGILMGSGSRVIKVSRI